MTYVYLYLNNLERDVKGGRYFLITLILFSSVCRFRLRVAAEDSKGDECFTLFLAQHSHCFLFDFPPAWLPSGEGTMPRANVQTRIQDKLLCLTRFPLYYYRSLVRKLLRSVYGTYGAP
jgi:hypothetical protein